MLDLPRFAIVSYNKDDYWELNSMTDLMRYEQARSELNRLRGKGCDNCYLIAITFIAGPGSDI